MPAASPASLSHPTC
jgi:hypothetical protein